MTITATDAASAVQTVTIPACATNITFTVLGGGGGASVMAAGALITGTIKPTGTDLTLQLIAGQQGWPRGSAKVNVAPAGFGNGGLGANRYNVGGNGIWLVDGGYGGAGSAITAGGLPLVVAGGAGGDANAQSSSGQSATGGIGGSGGLTPADGTDGSRGGGAFAGGGRGASGASAGAGGIATGLLENKNGTAGTTTSGTTGGGGNGAKPAAGDNAASGGGGGGGYAGGGGGASVWSAPLNSGGGGGGGAGSNFVGAAGTVVPLTSTITTGSRGQGSVTINWS
ncbi:hypothetical protein [Microbacterium sp.]|uniref:hypothetical protein n=1 Tax=Microbacterium sp. TaxID=51671 RepID=UPI001ACAB3C9|nr:hypothetical protein [Microbacterium sp.]MBN9156553.1 hypothetical protein [Microbacterium sp.]